MNPAPSDRLAQLSSLHPEWRPWLSLVEQTTSAIDDQRWQQPLPPPTRTSPDAPLLAAAKIALPRELTERWLKLLLRTAAKGGTAQLSTLKPSGERRADAMEWLGAALLSDNQLVERIAADLRADRGAIRSITQLLPLPLLHACRRAWSKPEHEFWLHSYCPICGEFPALAEVRGIERTRYLRCGHCGENWAAYGLRCVFCGLDDHKELVSLIVETAGPARSVEACKRCGGYLKSLTVLQASDPRHVLLDDLASVDLDIAAIEQGFHRPEGPGFRIDPSITCSDNDTKGFFSWRQ